MPLKILVYSVTQPTDTSTASGRLQQNIHFIFSEYDNQVRREKCMDGVKEKLLIGIWCVPPPMGYDIVRREGRKEYVINKTGKLIGKGFHWKAEGISNEEVRLRMASHGLNLTKQRLSDILRNPFYCSLIVHKALEGSVIEGIQEKAVSREVFLKVNGILANHHQGYTVQSENDIIPLKRFLKCDECGSYLRGYKAYKNQKYYYKCKRKAIAEELGKMGNEVSNLDKCVDEIINYASNLATTWDLAAYAEKQQLQFLLFPEGMSYNRKIDECRTPRINEVFLQIAEQAQGLTENKNGNNTFVSLPSSFVPRTGVEPVIPP